MLSLVLSACPQEYMFDMKSLVCSSRQQGSCTSELEAGRRKMLVLYPVLSKEVRGQTEWKMRCSMWVRLQEEAVLQVIRMSWLFQAGILGCAAILAGWREELPAFLTDWMGSLHFAVSSWSAPCWLTHCYFPLAQNWEEAAGVVSWLDLWTFLQIWIYTQSIIKPVCAMYYLLASKVKSHCSEFLCFQHSISSTTKLKQYHWYMSVVLISYLKVSIIHCSPVKGVIKTLTL